MMADPVLVDSLIAAGIAAAVALLWKMDRSLNRLTSVIAGLSHDFDEHRKNNREDFRDVWEKIDALKETT